MNNFRFLSRVSRVAMILALTAACTAMGHAQNGTPPPGGWHHNGKPAAPGTTPPTNTAPAAAAPGQTATPGAVSGPLARTRLVPTPRPVGAPTVAPKNERGEQFFIVASVDLQKSQLLLKYPTEVTLLVKIDPKTNMQDESGKPLKLTDFRAGDTVWVNSTTAKGDTESTATRVRKGEMTVADLHKYYLDYAEIH
jgi:hypothetical protein